MMQIFLDDEREPINSLDWIIARDYTEFVAVVLNLTEPLNHISFDHDLGEDSLTGYDCVKYLVEIDQNRKGKLLPPDFTFFVHSQNPVGKANIEGLLGQYLEWKRIN